ncbi:MAG: c-type cytochrome [Bdellovibrionales bacterium]|nr:c-type cytochrome [Bdellovibrionales bacterium]
MRKMMLIWTVFSQLVSIAAFADVSDGQKLFQQRCISCHTVGKGKGVGPDLQGVTQRREQAWLHRWIREPDKMLAENDPTATALLKEYNQVPMPNMAITPEQADQILAYLANPTAEAAASGDANTAAGTTSEATSPGGSSQAHDQAPTFATRGRTQNIAFFSFLFIALVIVLVFFWVGSTTSNPQTIDMKAAYKLRKVFFISGSFVAMGILAITMSKTPYADALTTPDNVIYATAMQFSFTFSNEPVSSAQELSTVSPISSLEIPRDTLVEFRVTSLDATHGFAIYNQQGVVFAQTQAMPGYTNRLRVRFSEPGVYPVLCLEYCGAAHHMMRTSLVVK